MDVGTREDGEPYLVMEHLNGSDLRAVLRERGPLPIAEAVGYLMQVAEAVAEAHALGIVHRDLKPSNLFLTQSADGSAWVKVLDFGISKAIAPEIGPSSVLETHTGALVGSPEYMSPEQIRNAKRVDERSDIWSLGVVLYELLTGEVPFRGESVSGTLAAIAADPVRPIRALRSDIPPGLEAVILRCLEKNVDRRWASLASFARALLEFGPEEARASLVRIERLASGPAREAALSPNTPLDEQPTASATVRTWEGEPSTTRRSSARSRRALLMAILTALLLTFAAVLLFGPRQPREASAVRAGPAPAGSLLSQAQESEAVPSTSVEVVAASPSAQAPHLTPNRLSSTASARPRVAPARVAPARVPANDDEGTDDRK
jgi:serine/threonine-protein kinase